MRALLLAAEAAASGAAEAEGSGHAIAVAVALMVVAIGLFFLEILIPSFGFITLIGLACVAGALMAAFSVSTLVGLVFVAVVVVTIPLIVYVAIQMIRGTSLALGPQDTPSTEGGAPGGGEPGLAPGARGVVATTLRPSGVAVFDGRKVSVVTSGEMVEPGVQVEVLRADSIRTVVRSVRV